MFNAIFTLRMFFDQINEEITAFVHYASIDALGRSRSGWSNFCTLVGHFSKLFEFAGLSRLKTPIFVPKSEFSKKKKKGLHLESVCEIPIFVPKSGCSLKKKRSSIGIDL